MAGQLQVKALCHLVPAREYRIELWKTQGRQLIAWKGRPG